MPKVNRFQCTTAFHSQSATAIGQFNFKQGNKVCYWLPVERRESKRSQVSARWLGADWIHTASHTRALTWLNTCFHITVTASEDKNGEMRKHVTCNLSHDHNSWEKWKKMLHRCRHVIPFQKATTSIVTLVDGMLSHHVQPPYIFSCSPWQVSLAVTKCPHTFSWVERGTVRVEYFTLSYLESHIKTTIISSLH